jgi:DNA-directed RNA polymerase specialized sigma24 family protein
MSLGHLSPLRPADLLPVAETPTARLFRERYAELVSLAGLLLGDDEPAGAEAVVQDAFARFHLVRRRVPPDRHVAHLRGAVCAGARSRRRLRRVDAVRRTWRRDGDCGRPVLQAVPDPEVLAARRRREAVVLALGTLPRRRRECLALRYGLGLPEREVAEALGIGPAAVAIRVRLGAAALGLRLEPEP